MNLKEMVTQLLEDLASQKPTPMGVDTLWPEDPLPYRRLCEACNGNGVRLIKGGTSECSICHGHGWAR